MSVRDVPVDGPWFEETSMGVGAIGSKVSGGETTVDVDEPNTKVSPSI